MEMPSWLISFFTTFLAAFLGSMLSIWKFKREKVWQEKYQLYQNILSALEAMMLWANETSCRENMIPALATQSAEGGNRLAFLEARRIIVKTTSIGRLLLPRKVIDELVSLQKDLWDEIIREADEKYYDPNTPGESEALAQCAGNVAKLVSTRLDLVIKHARNDLR